MRLKDEQKERTIREKAIAMIVREGLDGLSMQKLAREAKVSPATLYIYFKDRDDLIIQLCLEENKKMMEATIKNFKPDMSLEEGLKVQWVNRAEFALKHPVSMSFLEQIRHSPYDDKASKLMDPSFRNAMCDFVKNNVERNELARMPVEVYWALAYSPLYQLIKYHSQGRGKPGWDPFTLTEEILMETLSKVVKSLKP